jgi:hypothetical protein
MVPKTIRQRAVTVYLPSEEQKERWETLSREAGISISKFVTENVENSLRQADETDLKSRSDLWQENNELKKRVQDLTKQCKLLDTVVEKLDQELRTYRNKPFLEEQFEGVRTYDRNLIDLLKRKEVVGDDEILASLGISPEESAAITSIRKQLESLASYGLVSSSSRGWKWKK